MKIKKTVCSLVAFITLAASLALLLSGCGAARPPKEENTLNILCTGFAAYDWTRQITKGSNSVSVELLAKSGIDIHNYSPSASDVASIASSDIIIYVGAASEEFIEETAGKDAELINLLSVLGEGALAVPESVSKHAEHNHINPHSHEYDEHVWLSLKNARLFCSRICESIIKKDAANEKLYKDNCAAYTNELEKLETSFYETARNGRVNSMLFADRFPFAYLMNDCNVSCVCAFDGCSSESDATFETVALLCKRLSSSDLSYIVISESGDTELARTVIEASGKQGECGVVVMNSISCLSRRQIDEGVSYIDIMKENLISFEKALS